METSIQNVLEQYALKGIKDLYGVEVNSISVRTTPPYYTGDFTISLYDLFKLKLNDDIGQKIGDYLVSQNIGIDTYTIVKGYLNISFTKTFWKNFILDFIPDLYQFERKNEKIVIEFCSPNTNKPLHLGHLRNIFLGDAISRLYEAIGYDVVKTNLVNDRGIHICKSMWAWEKFGQNDKPTSARKGDHLVGDYYVKFNEILETQIKDIMFKDNTLDYENALKLAPCMLEVQDMLYRWESGDSQILALWEQMNSWVYQGFDETYNDLGIKFDKTYKESETYLLGKQIVNEGLMKGIFYRHEDGSVRVDLSDEGLGEKLLLRSDGTSVYLTQDLGTADLKHNDFHAQQYIYVVGDEQDNHFKVLFTILKKLDRPYAEKLKHISYGMVELPSGKMKSREGNVVDADDLIKEVIKIAEIKSDKVRKSNDTYLWHTIGIGALKYYLLKVSKESKMIFNPENSVDFKGDTCTYIQYNLARIIAILSKSENFVPFDVRKIDYSFNNLESQILSKISVFKDVIYLSATTLDPALICKYVMDLSHLFSKYYENNLILVENKEEQFIRVQLCYLIQETLKTSLNLLGINYVNKM